MKATTKGRWVVAGLVLLSLVPAVAGISRLVQLSGHPVVTPENARFVGSPIPVVLHIVAATTYAIVGAFQLSAEFLRRWPRVHRWMGRVLVASGLITALSGLWMTVAYQLPANLQGPLLFGVRLVIGTAMTAFLILGLRAILKRQASAHKAWMIRAYALGQGAGTQVFTNLPWVLAFGTPVLAVYEMLMIAGWVINVTVGETVIRRKGLRS
jgi:hypothetical protein